MSKYLKLANRNLSNNFTGEKTMGNSVGNLVSAVSNKFGISIKNEATSPINLALIPAYYDTYSNAGGGNYHNIAALNVAGAQVDAVIDEGTWVIPESGDKNITIHSTDTTKHVRDFLAYIKHYPQFLAKIRIYTQNQEVYHNSFKISYVNPFSDAERKKIDLGQYFSADQYQDGFIDIDLSGVDFPITPDCLLTMEVPGETNVTVDLFCR